MNPRFAATLALMLLGCSKKDPQAAPPVATEPSPLERRCARCVDHVADIMLAAPNVPADTKASVRADRADPAKRAQRIAECTKQAPALTTCFLEATNVEVVMECAIKYVPLPPDKPDALVTPPR